MNRIVIYLALAAVWVSPLFSAAHNKNSRHTKGRRTGRHRIQKSSSATSSSKSHAKPSNTQIKPKAHAVYTKGDLRADLYTQVSESDYAELLQRTNTLFLVRDELDTDCRKKAAQENAYKKPLGQLPDRSWNKLVKELREKDNFESSANNFLISFDLLSIVFCEQQRMQFVKSLFGGYANSEMHALDFENFSKNVEGFKRKFKLINKLKDKKVVESLEGDKLEALKTVTYVFELIIARYGFRLADQMKKNIVVLGDHEDVTFFVKNGLLKNGWKEADASAVHMACPPSARREIETGEIDGPHFHTVDHSDTVYNQPNHRWVSAELTEDGENNQDSSSDNGLPESRVQEDTDTPAAHRADLPSVSEEIEDSYEDGENNQGSSSDNGLPESSAQEDADTAPAPHNACSSSVSTDSSAKVGASLNPLVYGPIALVAVAVAGGIYAEYKEQWFSSRWQMLCSSCEDVKNFLATLIPSSTGNAVSTLPSTGI